MEPSFLGGILTRQAAEQRRSAGLPAGIADESWGWIGETAELFLRESRSCCQVFCWDSLVLLLRGPVRPIGARGSIDIERVAEELRCQYLEQGNLAVESLEGSYSVVLLDGRTDRVVLYRSLVGNGFTYYHASSEGLLFGGSLPELVASAAHPPRPNHRALPGFFLFRLVPGRDTLFEGFHRLLPGEEVSWEAGKLERRQRQTWADLADAPEPADPVEELEDILEQVLADSLTLHPHSANLLSGGVDSCYLQALFNRITGQLLPSTFSIGVSHPQTWMDTHYALEASHTLGTRHTLIAADAPYGDYLIETLAATGEPPNHVQTAYFGHLARSMAEHGLSGCFSAVGADSLFGLETARLIHDAGRARRWAPHPLLRAGLGRLAGWLGKDHWARSFWLADHLHDEEDFRHPVNQTATFTSWPAVEQMFGRAGVSRALGDRRQMLDHLAVPGTPLDRQHGACYFGMAIHTASLWATLFSQAGLDLCCPFLDSRVIRLAARMPAETRICPAEPKDLVKQALSRHLPREQVYRQKLSFGQPIFEWLRPGGLLRPLVDRMDVHDFMDRQTLQRMAARPSWALYSLLCYDLWHKLFISQSLPARPGSREPKPASAHGLMTHRSACVKGC